ncbi:Sua5 YciO YrdC YwlC family protein [Sulfurospirillum diekertiae]|uniref:Sua5 YciO YrdC YwlC family protein n=1 Tax=Sulfurospirillum diekertiae TaxID=1854492 RepID=A0A6G9VTJ4_9BACT|nr:Sua5/YciO/YrdC/YwlC family protein [Sulfurospirillum diekertiae]QIR76218.1 Sua5 YciO YrdC YwlC family protein [Sulfurospirillum diekertiae]QIR78847.1 Sua5 YciO YrdC YwlC family protein [Sulfurospirillum diekertiae]
MNPNLVYLAQTETTVGFLSQNAEALARTKNRPKGKPFLISVDSLNTLRSFTRVPKHHKNRVRRTQKTTFVYPCGLAIRVVKDEEHLQFLKKFKWSYSTSSNPSGKGFDEAFAIEKADVIVFTCKGFFEDKPSTIYKLGKRKLRKLR